MPNSIFLDTSFVLALINERDQYHAHAENLSHKFEESFLVTTDAVLLEIGNAMSRDFREQAVMIIRMLRNSVRVRVIEIETKIFDKGLERHERHKDKVWSLVDCISFEVLKENGIREAFDV